MKRTFVFLQGPQGPFFARLGDALAAQGHRVLRVNFNGGDEHDWPGGLPYRGRPEDWPGKIEGLMKLRGVTDIALYGDCRPLHRAAIGVANRLGIAVHVFEEAYFRPGYMTLERGGVNGFSSLPRTAAGIRKAARGVAEAPPPFTPQQSRGAEAFRYYTRAHWSKLRGRYPHAGWHREVSPLEEGTGYLRRAARSLADRTADAEARAQFERRRYLLLPLQMNRDFQLRMHSRFGSMERALDHVLAAFREDAPEDLHLVAKRHPLDNGLVDWRARLQQPRVHYVVDTPLDELISSAAGMVTVNSTSALAAMERGVPVRALGDAIYRMDGLTDERPLAAFFRSPRPPQADLFRDFRNVVIGRAQIPGYYSCERGLNSLVREAAARMTGAADETLRRAA